jgi:hypothetical protein
MEKKRGKYKNSKGGRDGHSGEGGTREDLNEKRNDK